MFKKLKYIFYIIFFLIHVVIANNNSVTVLQNRLSEINNLYFCFIQKNNGVDKNILREYQGEFWSKRPNLFYWHMIYPEENFLIFDGKILWFYVPVIKQVTMYCIESVLDSVFWMLFVNDNISVWNNYNVCQQGDYFSIEPSCSNISVQKYKVKITDSGVIQQFSIIEPNGEHIDYYLSQQNNNEIDVARFSFVLPEGVQVDDQRK